MELAVYWTRFAENKLDDIYDYYKPTSTIEPSNHETNAPIATIETTAPTEL